MTATPSAMAARPRRPGKTVRATASGKRTPAKGRSTTLGRTLSMASGKRTPAKGRSTTLGKALRPRNPMARSPLLAKGGAHGKSEQALRKRAKEALAARLRRKGGDEDD